MNNKYNKISGPINDIMKAPFEKREEVKDNAIKKFKTHFKLCAKYYLFFEQSDNILQKYENSEKLSQKLGDDYEKIKRQIDNLNRIGFKDIFETVKDELEKQAALNEDNNDIGLDSNNDDENLRRVSTAFVQEALNRDEFLKKREEELQAIHIISKQIKDTTQNMAIELNQQGEKLGNIENNVEEALGNAQKAHEEIKKADETSSKNKKKMWCLICIVTVSVLGISAIILSLIFGNK